MQARPIPDPALHVDDHDAALRAVAVLLLFPLVPLSFPLRRLLVFGLPTPVALRDLKPRAILTSSLFLFATTDLFDDPRLEHDGEPLDRCLQYLFLLVKFGNSADKREA
jgi:hypothetical protein